MASFAGGSGSGSPVIGSEIDLCIISGRNLKACDTKLFGKGSSDPFVVVKFQGAASKKIRVLGKTKTIKKNLNPTWNHPMKFHFNVQDSSPQGELIFEIYDHDKMSASDPMGQVRLRFSQFQNGIVQKWFTVEKMKGCKRPKGDLQLKLSYNARHAVCIERGGCIQMNNGIGFCMGWDMINRTVPIDLDTSAVVFDAKGTLLTSECIYFGNLRNQNGSMIHSGDEREGDEDLGEGDDERIFVDFARLPSHFAVMYFIGTVATSGKSFADVKSAHMRIVDWATGSEMCRFIPSMAGGHTALILGRAAKDLRTQKWTFSVIGDADHTARDWGTLVPEMKAYMKDLIPNIRVDPMERVAVMRKNGGSVALRDYCHPIPAQLCFGLAWDITNGRNIDLDASVILLDANLQQVDIIFFGKLRSSDGSIVHGGDEREGDEKGDDEKMFLNLQAVHPAVKYICFVVNSYSGEELDDISSASCHLFDPATYRDIILFQLTNTKFLDKKTALVMGFLFREGPEYGFQVVAEGALGRTAQANVDEFQRYISAHPPKPLPPPRGATCSVPGMPPMHAIAMGAMATAPPPVAELANLSM